jgi:hypothetical protein
MIGRRYSSPDGDVYLCIPHVEAWIWAGRTLWVRAGSAGNMLEQLTTWASDEGPCQECQVVDDFLNDVDW